MSNLSLASFNGPALPAGVGVISSGTFASRAGPSDYLRREVGTSPGHQWRPPLAKTGTSPATSGDFLMATDNHRRRRLVVSMEIRV
ncbi:MAG: hypothetical protein M3O70_21005 [Actinomycetota bacterium]|nr:hypothetical protein [Actinomycetota bacterium]